MTVNELILEKKKIETEISNILDLLNSESLGSVGLETPLIDLEGFPLSGLDLLVIRQNRRKFFELKNDLKLILNKIENEIHKIHQIARDEGNINSGDTRAQRLSFGRVDMIAVGSPADDAGLLVGDKISKFGPLSTFSPDSVDVCYDAIPSVPRDSSIEVIVTRLGRGELHLTIQPREGKLGCCIKKI